MIQQASRLCLRDIVSKRIISVIPNNDCCKKRFLGIRETENKLKPKRKCNGNFIAR